MRMRHIILYSLASLALSYFSTLSHKWHDFRKKNIEHKFDFLYYFCLKHFLFRRSTERYIINVHRSSCKAPAILVRFEWKLNFLKGFPKNVQICNYWKSVQCQPSCSMQKNRQTDRKTDCIWWRQKSLFANLRTRLRTLHYYSYVS